MTEEWRPASVAGYEVSSLGRVRTLRGPWPVVMKLQRGNRGHSWAGLVNAEGRQVTRFVHRMVCEAWHGPPPTPKHQAAHGDCDKENNRPENLRWATQAENLADCKRNGCYL